MTGETVWFEPGAAAGQVRGALAYSLWWTRTGESLEETCWIALRSDRRGSASRYRRVVPSRQAGPGLESQSSRLLLRFSSRSDRYGSPNRHRRKSCRALGFLVIDRAAT